MNLYGHFTLGLHSSFQPTLNDFVLQKSLSRGSKIKSIFRGSKILVMKRMPGRDLAILRNQINSRATILWIL